MRKRYPDDQILKIYGNYGNNWLSGLPLRIEQLQQLWGLSKLTLFPNLSYSYVFSGLKGRVPVVLKLSPDANLINQEAMALNAFEGFGAVSVLGHDEGALLLEQALPGELLKNSLSKEKRIEIACKVIRKLHQAPMPSKQGFPVIEDWLATIDKEWDLPQNHLKKARNLKNELLKKSSGCRVLLHGDLHQENILSKGDGWAIIDPKGVIGDPIHEIWACVENPSHDLKFLSEHFSYPLQDVVRWYYVRLILAACWQIEDGLDTSHFLTLAQSVHPLV